MKLRITVLAASLLFSAAAWRKRGAVMATGAAAPAEANARVEQHIKELHPAPDYARRRTAMGRRRADHARQRRRSTN